jgi:site-specific recombinase XerD
MKLQSLIEQYISYRQSLGEKQNSNGRRLRAFGRFMGAKVELADVRLEQVSTFLAGAGAITVTWHHKLATLRGFYKYAISRGYAVAAPLPVIIRRLPPAFIPYIYSIAELRRLLRAAKSYHRHRLRFEPDTLHTMILTLCGTGLRIQELIDLNRKDVNLADSIIKVQHGKFGKTRLVPFGPQLCRALRGYVKRHPVSPPEDSLFVTCLAVRVKTDTFQRNYRILCKLVGIRRTDGASRQPRIHDLRHTFAVHRLTSWYRQGADVQKLLPLLSVYLGHVNIQATQIYLSMTPELLAEANHRFEKYTTQEVSHD